MKQGDSARYKSANDNGSYGVHIGQRCVGALKNIETYYTPQYAQSNYFAVISKPILFSFAIDGKDSGSITLE